MIKIENTVLKGAGVFAEKSYEKGETVLVGTIAEELADNNSHASQIDVNRFILHDETYRLVNHSCDPTCGIKPNSTGAHNLIAIKEIVKGKEITFDYAMENYTIEHFPVQCKCGAKQCRGKITGWKDLPDDKKKEYHSWAAPYVLKLDAELISK